MKTQASISQELAAQFGSPMPAVVSLVDEAQKVHTHARFGFPDKIDYGRVWIGKQLFEIQIRLVPTVTEQMQPNGSAVTIVTDGMADTPVPFQREGTEDWYVQAFGTTHGPFSSSVQASAEVVLLGLPPANMDFRQPEENYGERNETPGFFRR